MDQEKNTKEIVFNEKQAIERMNKIQQSIDTHELFFEIDNEKLDELMEKNKIEVEKNKINGKENETNNPPKENV